MSIDISLDSRVPFGLKQITGHIPVLGHLRPFRSETEDGFTPARPTASLRPRLPADMTRDLPEETTVDVMASIDKHGAVKKAEAIGGAESGLGRLAADTVRSVTWQPARSGDHEVSTEVVIHYRFSPSQMALSTSNPH